MSGTFFCSIYKANPKATGCFSLVNTSGGTGHRKHNGSSRYATYKLDFSGQVSQNDMTPRETRPYNIALTYLIKVK
jgi:hypothetical protein